MLHQALHVEVRLVLQVLRHRVSLLTQLLPCHPQVYLLLHEVSQFLCHQAHSRALQAVAQVCLRVSHLAPAPVMHHHIHRVVSLVIHPANAQVRRHLVSLLAQHQALHLEVCLCSTIKCTVKVSVRKSIQQSLEQPEYLTFRYSIRRTEFFAVKRGIIDFPEIIAIKRTIELTIKLAVCESIVGTIEQSQFFAIKLTV